MNSGVIVEKSILLGYIDESVYWYSSALLCLGFIVAPSMLHFVLKSTNLYDAVIIDGKLYRFITLMREEKRVHNR